MESREYDVVVIGGGPAANAAAIYALQQGLSVCIIERELFPRDRPGETLHPGIEPLLKQLGVLKAVNQANFIRHSGTFIQWDEPFEFQKFSEDSEWLGYQAYRRMFDNILLEHSKQLGAEILMECSAEQVIFNDSRVKGIIVNNKNNKKNITINAKYVLDASGSWHWLTRQLNIPINYFSKQLVVRYGYARGACLVRDKAPAIVADNTGWTWTARVEEDLYQWTRLSLDGYSDNDFFPEEFNDLIPEGKARGADVTWRLVEKTAGAGFFIIGDAAAVLDPASSHGVLRAVMSGIRAADLITHILHKRCPEKIAIQEYNEWLWEWFFHDIQRLSLLYKQMYGNKIFV